MPKLILSWLPKVGLQSGLLFSSSKLVKKVHVTSKFWQYQSSNTDKIKATDNAAITFTQGSHSLLVHQSIQTAARNAAANKQSHPDAQKARARALKRYEQFLQNAWSLNTMTL
ncbi:MAG: hypothetical protein ACI808_000979 [Paraglaciecola sp.]|jgi:hypothetical protein